MPSMIPFRKIDNKKFLRVSNLKFKKTIYTGLIKTIKWYRKNY